MVGHLLDSSGGRGYPWACAFTMFPGEGRHGNSGIEARHGKDRNSDIGLAQLQSPQVPPDVPSF